MGLQLASAALLLAGCFATGFLPRSSPTRSTRVASRARCGESSSSRGPCVAGGNFTRLIRMNDTITDPTLRKNIVRGYVATVFMYTRPYIAGLRIWELRGKEMCYYSVHRFTPRRKKHLPENLNDTKSPKQSSVLLTTSSTIEFKRNALKGWRETTAHRAEDTEEREGQGGRCQRHKGVSDYLYSKRDAGEAEVESRRPSVFSGGRQLGPSGGAIGTSQERLGLRSGRLIVSLGSAGSGFPKCDELDNGCRTTFETTQ